MPQSYLNYESVLFLKVIFNNLSCEHGALSLNVYNSLETKGKMEELTGNQTLSMKPCLAMSLQDSQP